MNVFKFDYNSLDDLVSNTYVAADDDLNCVVIDPGKAPLEKKQTLSDKEYRAY